jgi:hypothetical protein
MDQTTDIWTPHLKPGERVLWSASFSQAIRTADRARTRRSAAIVAAASGVLAVFAGYRFYEAAFLGQGQPDLSAAVAAPLFLAFGAALAVLCFFMIRKLKLPLPDADHYAATSLRLLAVDGKGKLVDEMTGADIAGAVFDNDRRPTELHIIPRDGDERMFFIEHIENLPAVRARIIDIFPEAPP